ncbi:Hypothetical predicted protein [Mytilus galloprovincialis]|uniref:Uncharacterized protein n=1 Tax=Mytilus galloprovincialis TaxID=29158 RepID=A0A8B6FI11_MYTGA|nr:Hypothetical predicted protein [Mytilus galloprovincialis]
MPMNFTSGTPPSFVLQNKTDSIASNITESLDQDWAKDVHKNRITNVVVLSVYFVIGVVGNSLVLAVYKTQLKHASAERTHVPCFITLYRFPEVFTNMSTPITKPESSSPNGPRCGRLKTSLYLPGAIYAISFVSLMVLTVLALVFFYGRVAYTIFKHFKSNPSRKYSINPLPKESNGKYQVAKLMKRSIRQKIIAHRTRLKISEKITRHQIVAVGINNLSIDAVTDDKIQAEDTRNSNSDNSKGKV